jgi:hypothetical protein
MAKQETVTLGIRLSKKGYDDVSYVAETMGLSKRAALETLARREAARMRKEAAKLWAQEERAKRALARRAREVAEARE